MRRSFAVVGLFVLASCGLVVDLGSDYHGTPGNGDAGSVDAGSLDAGPADAGTDAGLDAGTDAGLDAGMPPCDTGVGASSAQDCPGGMVCGKVLHQDYSSFTVCETPQYSAAYGIVTDGVTGLQWQQTVPTSQCATDLSGYCSWQDAQTYCQSLTLGSFTDWRLPTIAELFSLVDIAMSPTIDQSMFPNTPVDPSLWYWSSTAGATGSAWGVSFTDGSVNASYTMSANKVRCVR